MDGALKSSSNDSGVRSPLSGVLSFGRGVLQAGGSVEDTLFSQVFADGVNPIGTDLGSAF